MTAVTSAATTLVLGIGNTLLADDGVGVRIVESLRADPDMAQHTLIDGGTVSFGLLTHLEDARAMLVIDAANLEAAPGTVRVYELDAMDRFIRRSRGRSVHEVGLADVMDMARLHGCLPPQRALVCIQPERIDWGEALSPAVEAGARSAREQVRQLLGRWDS
ncbi:MAG: HyaD/HybD family hydrogenase maturation endopeptidase [Gammaproteobacteria bacterium]